jgi:23S rRNA (guanine1835-N2)-methyltransferase
MNIPFPPADSFGKQIGLNFYPPTSDSSLRPWDGADEYLLEKIREEYGTRLPMEILIANDSFGALTLPLAPSATINLNDSYSAARCIEQNFKDNSLEEKLTFRTYQDSVETAPDLIIMKIPKAVPFFKFQLEQLSRMITKPTPILAAGLSKLMPPSFFETFEGATDKAKYSLIKKRARLYEGTLLPSKELSPSSRQFNWKDKPFSTLPGVFSYGKVDKGSLFLLDRFPRATDPEVIVDPGCGCGILGIEAAQTWPNARIIATDDSAVAIESTRLSAEQNNVSDRMEIRHTNILDGMDNESADLVICNPPFHSQHRIQLEQGFAFINESHRVLKPEGQLFLVANRYLGYEKHLKELFSGMKIIGQDQKFRLFMCRK